MLYTRKGDSGTTTKFDCNQRFSKSSEIAWALGSVDELNSVTGICRTKAQGFEYKILKKSLEDILEDVQQNLFIIQAILAGADKKLPRDSIENLEKTIDSSEEEFGPITSFYLSGGSELGSFLDMARTVCRRAERQVVAAFEKEEEAYGKKEVFSENKVLAYLNRLSSLFYALNRFVNFKLKVEEKTPRY